MHTTTHSVVTHAPVVPAEGQTWCTKSKETVGTWKIVRIQSKDRFVVVDLSKPNRYRVVTRTNFLQKFACGANVWLTPNEKQTTWRTEFLLFGEANPGAKPVWFLVSFVVKAPYRLAAIEAARRKARRDYPLYKRKLHTVVKL
jgi:hypothetical protein